MTLDIQLVPIPALTILITFPQNSAVLNSTPITVTGNVSNNAQVSVNGVPATVSSGTWSASVPLSEGQNPITAVATDQYNQTISNSITVTLELPKPPQISNISANNITTDSVVISWTTDHPADSLVEYGETVAYGGTASDAGLVTTHSIILNNLSPNKTYHFKVTSRNGYDISSSSGDNTFTTLLIPPPVISNIAQTDITTNFATITWTTDQPTSSVIEYGTTETYGSSLSDPALTTIHSIQLPNLSSGTAYHFKITAANVYGTLASSSDNTFTTLSPITITIASPLNNETINRTDVLVKGTITNSTGNETGVTVNGIVAAINDNQFIVNHVPLTEGVNTITVTATDTAGNTLSNSVSVNAVTTGNYIRLNSNIESGISPLQVTLKIDGSFSITTSDISVTGPGSVEFLPGTLVDEYEMVMTTEGIYYFTVSVTGPDNVVYKDTVAITVLNKNQLDTLLRGKWTAMTNNLSIRDITTALNYISPITRPTNETIFNEILEQLPLYVSTHRELNFLYAVDNIAKYELVTLENNKLYSYEVTFVKDENGRWVISQF